MIGKYLADQRVGSGKRGFILIKWQMNPRFRAEKPQVVSIAVCNWIEPFLKTMVSEFISLLVP
jgi:hypothetical protein